MLENPAVANLVNTPNGWNPRAPCERSSNPVVFMTKGRAVNCRYFVCIWSVRIGFSHRLIARALGFVNFATVPKTDAWRIAVEANFAGHLRRRPFPQMLRAVGTSGVCKVRLSRHRFNLGNINFGAGRDAQGLGREICPGCLVEGAVFQIIRVDPDLKVAVGRGDLHAAISSDLQ